LFFEAYFSNFIEGIEFEIKEAHEIIFEQKIPKNRTQDAFDILGTYQVISHPTEIGRIPTSFVEFENLLKNRHAILMRGCPEKLPGQYKTMMNRVGAKKYL